MQVGPDDAVHGAGGHPDGATVLEFWRWAFADLSDDDVKGWFAEWLVGRILGLPMARRISWANSDHVTPEGMRIEIKSSAYWQSWKLINEDGTARTVEPIVDPARARVYFAGLIAGDSASTAAGAPRLKSDVYVFAFQKQADAAQWDALDLRQWDFHVLTKQEVAAIGTRSIGLARLRSACPPMTAAGLRARVDDLRRAWPSR